MTLQAVAEEPRDIDERLKSAELGRQAIDDILALVDGDGESEVDQTIECFGAMSLKPIYRGDDVPTVSRAPSESDASWDSLDTASLDSDILAACMSSPVIRLSPRDGRAADGSALDIGETLSIYEEAAEAEADAQQATREVMDMVTVAPNVVLANRSDASRPLPRSCRSRTPRRRRRWCVRRRVRWRSRARCTSCGGTRSGS